MDKILDEEEVQEKITKIVQKRHEQISEIKIYFNWNNKELYKGITPLGENLQKFETIYNKKEYHLKCEDIISLTLSIGKIMDLNNSIKTILLSIKIFEEHKNYINSRNNNDNNKKTYIATLFDKSNSIPLCHNNFLKQRIKDHLYFDINDSYMNMKKFYESLFGNDSSFFNDLNNFYNYHNESNQKENNNNKNKQEEIIINKLKKTSNKFYIRMPIYYELDYPSTIYTACDLFYMLYNKMMDNICYNPNFISYIEELDNYIISYFIQPCLNDLSKISELIIKNEVDELSSNLEKFYK